MTKKNFTSLQQAEFFGIGVQTVGLGVEGDPRGFGEPGENGGQLRFGIDHGAV